MNIIEELIKHETEVKEWLIKNYSQEKIDNEFEKLTENELKSVAYLLARQWDVGIIFPYFKEEISQVGMTEKQLLILAKYGLKSKEWSFKQQCAASIYKVKNNRDKAILIAMEYYKSNDNDIRRHALNSLYKLKYDNINQLLSYSWKQNYEFEMILCLYVWKEIEV